MKKLFVALLISALSINSLQALDILKMDGNLVISTELIDNAILKPSDSSASFEKLPEKERAELLTTIVKSLAVYHTDKNKLTSDFYQEIDGQKYSFKDFYNYQLGNLEKKITNENEFKLNRALLFYTLWNAQKIKYYSDTIKISDEKLKEAYKQLEDKFNMPEARQFAFIQSENKETIKKLIATFRFSGANRNIQLVKEFFTNAQQEKDVKVIYDLNREGGISKDYMEKEFADKIWDMKTNDFSQEPIAFDNKYFFVYMTNVYHAKKYEFEEVKDKLMLTVKKYEVMKNLSKDITESIKKSNIEFLNTDK